MNKGFIVPRRPIQQPKFTLSASAKHANSKTVDFQPVLLSYLQNVGALSKKRIEGSTSKTRSAQHSRSTSKGQGMKANKSVNPP
jgi:hypothetical protein